MSFGYANRATRQSTLRIAAVHKTAAEHGGWFFNPYPPAVLRGLFAVPPPLPARYGSSAPRVRAWRARQRERGMYV